MGEPNGPSKQNGTVVVGSQSVLHLILALNMLFHLLGRAVECKLSNRVPECGRRQHLPMPHA